MGNSRTRIKSVIDCGDTKFSSLQHNRTFLFHSYTGEYYQIACKKGSWYQAWFIFLFKK